MDVTIREAKVTDAEAIAEIGKVAWLAAYTDPATGITSKDVLSRNFDSPERIQKLKERLHKDNEEHSSGGRTWVAEVPSTGGGQAAGNVIGFVTALRIAGNELKAIYILPSYQDHGAGHKLMETALAWFTQSGVEGLGSGEVHANVGGKDGRTKEFFREFGFAETGEKKTVSFATGKTMEAVVMRRAAA